MASVIKVRGRSAEEIEEIANNIINEFQPEVFEPIQSFDVEAFFEFELKKFTGLEPLYKNLPDELEGYTDVTNMECVISKKLAEHDEDQVIKRRFRATQAHEIGHCVLHVRDTIRNLESEIKFLHDKASSFERYSPENIKAYQNPEWQAWRFASALLMPRRSVETLVERNWTRRNMRTAFDVNPTFLNVRLRELKISKNLKNG